MFHHSTKDLHTVTLELGRRHIELFPNKRVLPEDIVVTLKEIDMHSHVETTTSETGLAPFASSEVASIGDHPFEELYCSGDPIPSQVSQFALVDYDVLDTRHASPTARVVAVIDHHEDEGQYKDTSTTNPRIVEPAGSCSSLVTRLYQSSSNLSIPPEMSTLLLSAILIDTRGLKDGAKLWVLAGRQLRF
ncbi:uncharacterized protein F5891DRAFT_31463 [Suillus fuscotomentosus]|uniref:DDH domain-containing protein n=1 Tax=Suillus fuscotomentosus TaxID=1912939 RepID=A0AAD4EQX6_9AGAM|nr:uncharacterized protein F5891DRAFT_31463 [Suillus fuscotomentosus]KAG1908883.1 hypothetical protein F5891DRAFT_31463 [Suillus fuscotomentosus]